MVKAGGYDRDLNCKASERRIENESFNGLKNKRLTLAMARLTIQILQMQFFINVRDNPHLDAQPGQPGYRIRQVDDGLDVIETIELTDTHLRMGMVAVPEETIIIVATKVL